MNEKSSPEAPELAQEQDQQISGPDGQKPTGECHYSPTRHQGSVQRGARDFQKLSLKYPAVFPKYSSATHKYDSVWSYLRVIPDDP
jgi:hypothetical protein